MPKKMQVELHVSSEDVEKTINEMSESPDLTISAVANLYKLIHKLSISWMERELKNVKKGESAHEIVNAAISGYVGLLISTTMPLSKPGTEIEAIKALKEGVRIEFNRVIDAAHNTDFSVRTKREKWDNEVDVGVRH